MGNCPDWQRQNMKKTGASGPTTTPSRKDLGSLFHSAPAPQNKSMTKPMYLADGDTEETYKARGAEASSGDNVGFFERMRMGNIDQPGSEAYNRFGAGRGKEVESEVTRLASRAAAAQSARDDADFADMDREVSSGRSVSGTESEPTYGRDSVREVQTRSANTPSRPVVRRSATSSVSGTASTSAESMRAYKPRVSQDTNYGNEGRRTRVADVPQTARGSSSGQSRVLTNVKPADVDPKTLLPKR